MGNKITSDYKNRYEFPKSEEIVIHRSDLQIQLEIFKTRVLSSFSIFDLLAIISLWAPVISGGFRNMFGLNPDQIQSGYIVFATLITFAIFYSKVKYLFNKRTDISNDPRIMAEQILEQCNPKSKK